nr:hypothetical protein [Tanacetum cinerariifolium]
PEGTDRAAVERAGAPGGRRPGLVQRRPARLCARRRRRLRRERQAGAGALAGQRLPQLFADGVRARPEEHRHHRRGLDQ